MQKLVKLVIRRGYDPFIVFSFGKKECEAHAVAMSGLDLNTGERPASPCVHRLGGGVVWGSGPGGGG